MAARNAHLPSSGRAGRERSWSFGTRADAGARGGRGTGDRPQTPGLPPSTARLSRSWRQPAPTNGPRAGDSRRSTDPPPEIHGTDESMSRYTIGIDGIEYSVEILEDTGSKVRVVVNDRELRRVGNSRRRPGGRAGAVASHRFLLHRAATFSPAGRAIAGASGEVRAPMPARVTEVLASAGDRVEERSAASQDRGHEDANILLLLAEDLGPRVGAFGDPVAVTPQPGPAGAGGHPLHPRLHHGRRVRAESRRAAHRRARDLDRVAAHAHLEQGLPVGAAARGEGLPRAAARRGLRDLHRLQARLPVQRHPCRLGPLHDLGRRGLHRALARSSGATGPSSA